MRKMKKKHKNKTKENETVMNEDRSHAPDKKKVVCFNSFALMLYRSVRGVNLVAYGS